MTSTAATAGGRGWYRCRTIAGCSTGRDPPRLWVSRTCWACAQVSGEAEPAAPPSTKPIDAVVGSVPYGEAARSGFSQACSGTSPIPEENRCIPSSSWDAEARSPVCSSCSARSPFSTGHT